MAWSKAMVEQTASRAQMMAESLGVSREEVARVSLILGPKLREMYAQLPADVTYNAFVAGMFLQMDVIASAAQSDKSR